LRRSDFLKGLGLLGLSSCIDINEDCMNKKKLYDWWAGGTTSFTGLATFKQFVESSDGGNGTVNFNNAAVPNGAAVNYTIGGIGSYIQTTVPSTPANSDAVALCLSERDDFNYGWTNYSGRFIIAVYHFSGPTLYYALNNDIDSAVNTGLTVSSGDVIRMERTSLTDIAVKLSTDGGSNFTTVTTQTVINNTDFPYPDIKIINSVQGSGKKLESIYGFGLKTKTTLPRTMGTIYSTSTWPSLVAFSNNGSTSSVVANKIQFSGGAGTFTQTLDLARFTCLEKWTMNARVKVGTKSVSSFGFGLGIRSSSDTLASSKYNICGRFVMTTGFPTVDGRVILNAGSGNTQVEISSSGLSFSVNDVIDITVTRDGYNISISAYNITTASSTISANYTFITQPNTEPYMANTGKFAIYSLGGTFTIQSLTISSNEYQNARIVLVGDSKTVGYNATLVTTRFANLLRDVYGSSNVVVIAGGSDGLGEHLDKIRELQSLTPTRFVIIGASNDFRASRTEANINADYASLVSQLLVSSDVIHTTGMKENVLNQTTLQTYINATYSAANIIDTLGTTLTLDSDGVHPIDAGFVTFKNLLVDSGKI